MPEAVAPESVAYTHEFTVDASYQRALTRALYLSQFRSPVTWILLGVILIFFGLSVLGGLNAFVAVWLILLALVWGLRYFRVRSMVRRSFPVGKVMRSGFTPTHFGVSDGDNSS